MNMNWLSNSKSILGWAALSVLLTGGVATAIWAQDKPAVVLPPTVEGDWVMLDYARSGGFSGLDPNTPKPKFTPAYQATVDNAPNNGPARGGGRGGSYRVGNSIVVNPHPCGYGGSVDGALNYSSYALHVLITQDKNEVVFNEEASGGSARHIYLDGRPIPPASLRTPTSTGYSVGHIEPDGTLVIETGDLSGAGRGAPHTPETILEQRYHPTPSGNHMTATFTWKDRKIFAEPYSYKYEFDRLAPNSYAFENTCNPTDTLEATSSVEPNQK